MRAVRPPISSGSRIDACGPTRPEGPNASQRATHERRAATFETYTDNGVRTVWSRRRSLGHTLWCILQIELGQSPHNEYGEELLYLLVLLVWSVLFLRDQARLK